MKRKIIVFTKPYTAECLEQDVPTVGENDVLVKTEYTVVRGGTERANLMGMANTGNHFPISLGYCGVGRVESYPHHCTHQDDCKAILDLISAKKVQVLPMVSRVVKPETAPKIYKELCENKDFPLGTVFDWREIK